MKHFAHKKPLFKWHIFIINSNNAGAAAGKHNCLFEDHNKTKKAFEALAPTEININPLVTNSWLNTKKKCKKARTAWETAMHGGDAG